MNKKVLVAYATKYGATAEIAEKMCEVLSEAGLNAEVVSVDEVRDVVLYDAIVLGSAVYAGYWRKEAAKFLQTHEAMLVQRPVWLFSSGPMGEGDPVELMEGWYFPKNLQASADRIEPEEITVFHGKLDTDQLTLFDRWIIKMVKAPSGDFRDWAVIEAWATAVADKLKEAHVVVESS